MIRKSYASTRVKQMYITQTYQQYLFRVRRDAELYEKLSLYGAAGGNAAKLIRELLRLFFERVELEEIPSLTLNNLRPYHTATLRSRPFDGSLLH